MTTKTILLIGPMANALYFLSSLTNTKTRHNKISAAKIRYEKTIKDFMRITFIEYPNDVNHMYIYLDKPKNIDNDSQIIKEKLQPMNIDYIMCNIPNPKNNTIDKWYQRATKIIDKKIPYIVTSYNDKYYFYVYNNKININFDTCEMRWESMMKLHTFAFNTESLISPLITINDDIIDDTEQILVQKYLDKLVLLIPNCIDNQKLKEDLVNENNLILCGLAIKINNILAYIYKYPDIFSLVIPFDTKLDITKKILLAYIKVTFPYMLITNITDNDFIINW